MRYPDAYDLKSFYNSIQGRIVRRIIRDKVLSLWPDTKALNILGFGYAVPYLKPFLEGSERTANIMPSQLGVHHWPEGEENLVTISAEHSIPLETNSVDRIIAVHTLEFLETPNGTFEELWRVLKSNGRLILIVPNRLGLWARVDSSPFGQGQPYSTKQVESFLRDNLFVHESTEGALFTPPFKTGFLFRAADVFEKIGRTIFPALGGVQVIEVSKQIYAGKGRLATAKVKKKVVPVKPVPTRRDLLDS
ncbi:MAG: methyltransferase domain-containing protein [Pseudomonadota bacterium]